MATAVNDKGCVSICPENRSTSTFPMSFTRALTCRLPLLSLSVYAIDALVGLQVFWQITRTFYIKKYMDVCNGKERSQQLAKVYSQYIRLIIIIQNVTAVLSLLVTLHVNYLELHGLVCYLLQT